MGLSVQVSSQASLVGQARAESSGEVRAPVEKEPV